MTKIMLKAALGLLSFILNYANLQPLKILLSDIAFNHGLNILPTLIVIDLFSLNH